MLLKFFKQVSDKKARQKHKQRHQDKHRWRNFIAWVLPFLTVPVAFTLFTTSTTGVYLSIFSWCVFIIYAVAMLERYIWHDTNRSVRALAVILCVVCVGIGFAWRKHLNAPVDPLIISPNVVNLSVSKGRTALQEIFVHNPNPIAYYDGWIKVVSDSPVLKMEKININRKEGSPINAPEMISDPTKALDNLLVSASIAPNALSVSIGRLIPNETKRYVFSYQNDGELTEGMDHKLLLSLDRFTTTPAPAGGFLSPDKEEERPKVVLKHVNLIKNREGRPAANVALINVGTDAFDFSCVPIIFSALETEAKNRQPPNVPTKPMNLSRGDWIDVTVALKPVDKAWKDNFASKQIGLYVWG